MKIFFTETVDTVAGHSFPALIDKQAVLIKRFGFDAVFGDIAFDELNGSLFQFYLSITVAFTQDGQGLVLRVKIVKVKHSDFTGPCAGVPEQMKDGVVTKAVFFYEVDAMKNLEDFIRIKKSDKLLLCTFLGNIQYPLSHLLFFRIH